MLGRCGVRCGDVVEVYVTGWWRGEVRCAYGEQSGEGEWLSGVGGRRNALCLAIVVV